MKFLRPLLRLIPLVLALALVAAAQVAAQLDTEEHHVTKAEAKELFRSLDDILQFASDQTGLPILHPVKKKLATRQEVAKYVEARLKEQQSGDRQDRSALTLKRLGLLPRDFNLREYMLGLYKEQVEGWYDSRTKTVYMLDWVEPELQKPVMAHELVHALQDQNYGLDKWLGAGKDSKDDSAQIALDEQRVARQAVVEGQATIILFDYELRATGETVETAPSQVESMRRSMLEEDSSPLYAQAPIYLREALLFPYDSGMEFVRAVLLKRGKQAAFSGVFEHPPTDTRQIMEPVTYLAAEPQPAINVVPLDTVLGPDWRREDVSGIGEIDLRLILLQWSGKDAAARLAPAWRGGYYMTLSHKNAPKDEAPPLALVLNFASPDAASQFAAVYEPELARRYRFVQPSQLPRQWTTEQGLVCLYVDGSTVTALESFSPADAARLHAALIPGARAAAAK